MYGKAEKQCERNEQVSCIKKTKTTFYTFRRQASVFNHHRQYNIKNICYFKRKRAALIITDTYHRLIAIDTWHSKWPCSYLQRKIVLLLRRIFRHKSLELGTSLWRRITDWPRNVLRKNPPKDSEIGYFDLGRCSVQSFSFKACFGIWKRIKNAEGETCWYRDPMPF